MEYSFDIEYAQAYGVAEAIMIKNFQYWIIKNKANGTNLYDGKTWTFNSVKSYTSIFPFWNKNQVERILVSLRKQEVLTTGNYNKAKYDRTRWYAFIDEKRFIDKNNSISAKQEMQSKKTINAIPQKQVTIPNSKTTYNKPKDNNPYYTELLFVYDKFCKETFDAPAKINGMEGKALKQIISYLKGLCKVKGDDSLEAVKNAFSYILSNWSSLEPFLQKQIKLSQINSNLANIINQLKNGTERKSNSSSLAAEILAKYS
tara:strand:+ start:1855 stop:2631 length:777 start_codon:yes stop_codon:yes gene_type:complete